VSYPNYDVESEKMATNHIDHQKTIAVSVIVVNYNGMRYLDNCLSSLKSQIYHESEIIMVDNDSSDLSVDYARSSFPDVQIIQSDSNLGYAGGCNLGAKFARGSYLIFVNNDMQFSGNWLEEMMRTALLDEYSGVITCKVMTSPEEKKIQHVGSTCDMFGYPLGYGYGEIDRGQYDMQKTVFFAMGDVIMIKRNLFLKIGGFDPKFFLYSEDVDLGWRTWLCGYKVLVNPSAVAYHKGRGSAKDKSVGGTNLLTNPLRRYLGERNTLRTMLKNYQGLTLFSILPRWLSLTVAEMLFFVVEKELPLFKSDMNAILWNLQNLKDTLTERNKVQQLRRIGDKKIKKMMLPGSIKVSLFKGAILFGGSKTQ
jgi:GT2 family glycosyltransferase